MVCIVLYRMCGIVYVRPYQSEKTTLKGQSTGPNIGEFAAYSVCVCVHLMAPFPLQTGRAWVDRCQPSNIWIKG